MSLLKNKNFYPTFWVQLFGALNNNIFKNAFVMLLAFKLGGMGNSSNVIMAGALFILPFFLFSAIAGDLADKYPKNVLTNKLKLCETFIALIGAIGFISHSAILLFVCIFLLGCQAAFYGPIKYSILPELLEEEKLIEANAFIEMGTFLAILTGTILGGVLINLGIGEYLVSGLCLSLSLIGYLFSLKIPSLGAINSSVVISWNIIKTNQKNFKIVYPQKNIFLTILGISWFWLLGSVLLSLFPLLVKDYLHGQESLVTLFLSLFCIGVAIGSFFCEKMSKAHLELGLVPVGSIGMVCALVDLYFSLGAYRYSGTALTLSQFLEQESSIRILVDLLIFAVSGGLYSVPLYSYLQIRTKREERSQIVSANNILNALFMVGGSVLLSAMLVAKVSFPNVILTLGLLSLAVAIYIYTFMPEFLWRFGCFILTKVIYNFKVSDFKAIHPDKALVVVANHVSFIDWLLISAAVNRPVRFVMDHNIYKNPILRFIFKSVNAIPIASPKDNIDTYNRAFADIKKALSENEVVCIFPEGKISQDGSMNPFKKGVETIMQQNPGVEVQPLVLKGVYGSFFSRVNQGRAFSHPLLLVKNLRKKIEVKFLTIVPHEEVSAEKLEAVTKTALN